MARLEIDPTKLGNLEVGWWRAHNDKDKPRMAQLLIKQNMALYGFSQEEAQSALQHLVEGVKYHDTREWDKAINSVAGYYEMIKNKTDLDFNQREMAELEVGWWHLHDELEHNPDKTALAEAFAKLYATQFGVEIEEMKNAGQLKAEATREHDLAEDPSTPPDEIEAHWDKANGLLVDFYRELKGVISSNQEASA